MQLDPWGFSLMEPSEYKPFAPEIHDYVGGRMSAEDEREFERRLAVNSELKGQVDQLRRALELLHSIPMQEPKPGFDERVIGRIREEDLAERARRQIASAPTPIWQHIVQVGLGAAAAALVLAVIGVPGMFEPEVDTLDGTGGAATVARVSATEDDLLPSLADQNSRFESLRRNVALTRLADPDLQRQFVAMELQYSDLQRRNRWLAEQVSGLPAAHRGQYERFLEQLESALDVVSSEVALSGSDRRAVDMGKVVGALNQVEVLQGAVGDYRLSMDSGMLVPRSDVMRTGSSKLGEVNLYSLVRRADYLHDYPAVIDAVTVYLNEFPQGYFADHASASAIAAHIRLAQDDDAAKLFARKFGDYDEDLKQGQLELVRGLMNAEEFERLTTARKLAREND